MKTPITSIKRLALALCFVMPLVSWAAVDYTGTDYEPWSYSAGCVVWRGTQNNFHESTIADVAADGTVGEAYTLNTSGHPWQVFASNQNQYTSPGLTLVFDASGYKANPDASFTPLSFGGLKVDALADETEGTPYSITGISTAARYTDFGRTDVATYFEFNKSFTVNRSSATRCYGAVTIQVAQDATFKSQGSLWAEVGGTVKLTGEGTVELPSGLYVNDNFTSTLDLSAATRPTITGNVTIYEGGAIALPAGTEPSEETPFTVCSGTLTVGANYNYVKIGDADPISATLTVSGGAITGIEPYSLERTFTSDYPTVVPAGAVFTFQGGTEDEPVTINSLSVAGTLKLEGYFNFPNNYNPGDNAELDVVSGSVTVTRGSTNWVKGTIKIRENATFVNAQTDALNYNGTVNVYVWGTLNMGATRWSLGSNNTINLYEGCTVTGSGDGGNGTLDWIENATANLNVTGPVTIDAPIKIRDTATVNVTVDSGANDGLTLKGSTIGVGTIVKKGAGLIKFTTNPSYAITCQNGAFTFGVNATPTITYTAKPSNSTSMWYARQSTWKGTVVIPAIAAGNTSTQILLENWGNANSSLTLNGISGNTWLTSNVEVPAAVTVAGDVGFSNGSRGSTYTFSKIAGGTGNLTFKAWANNASAKYAITELDADNYSGTIVIPSSNANQMTVKLGNIVKTGAGAGDKLVAISNGGGTFDISTATLNGEAADLEVKSDGIYVVVPTVTITVPTVPNASVVVSDGTTTYTPTTEGGTTYSVPAGSTITVTYTAAEGYGLEGTGSYTLTNVAEGDAVTITDTEAKLYVAQFNNVKYTTVQGAINAWAAVTEQATAYSLVSLLGDVTESSVAIPVGAAGMPCQINGGNHTLTAPVTIAEGAFLSPTALTIAGNLTVNGTYYRIGPAAIAVSGALTFGDGATIAVTALSSETSVFAATGAVTISGDLNVLLYSETLTAGEYTIATGASVTRAADSQVVVTLNETVTDTWALSNTETAVVLTGAAARVNGDTYPTFTEAVTAANGTETIELLAAASYTLTAGETVIVKAGSLTFTVSAPQGYVISETTVSDGVVSYTTSSALVRTTKEVYESGAWRTADGYPKEYASIVAAIAGITIAPVENSTRYTVTMLGNETLATRAEPNCSMTIDLGGYTLTREGTSGNGSAFRVMSGTVTIKNGTIDCTQDDTAIVKDGVYAIDVKNAEGKTGAAVVLESLSVYVDSQNGACVYPWAGTTATIKSGTYVNNTKTVYQYGRFHDAELFGMAVNQANVATQLLFIEGGTFSQINPALGDDSWADGAGTFVAAGYESTEDNGVWVVAALPNYTVTFDADGGTPAPAAQTVQKGSTATVPTEPTKDGFTFAGWTLSGSAYDFATPVTGNITLVASWTSSGINPAVDGSTQEVTPTAAEIEAAGSAEAAAIAKATVTVPTAAAEAGVDAATYKGYFTYSATPTATAGTYDVTITGFADEVTETADGNALSALEAATAGTALGSITVKPGLYYGTAAGADVTTLKAPAGTLNTTGTLDLSGVTKPSEGTAFFIKIKIGATAFTAEE